MIRYLSFVAMALALVAVQFAGGPAWAAKKAQATQVASFPGKCNGGVSTGCSPGSCRCP